ncbi:MAG: hypothetical protein GF332_03720 [Candidatus Moranbacteria bacterium]|nr:hypothetical protein [Candidatus Moranbacteria bacterium]
MQITRPAGGGAAAPQPQQGGSNVTILLLILLVIVLIAGGYFGYTYYLADIINPPEGAETTPTSPDNTGGTATNTGNKTGTTGVNDDEQGSKREKKTIKKPPGIKVGSLFIPKNLDNEALDFLQNLKNQGDLPVEVEQGMLGKDNPFLK